MGGGVCGLTPATLVNRTVAGVSEVGWSIMPMPRRSARAPSVQVSATETTSPVVAASGMSGVTKDRKWSMPRPTAAGRRRSLT
ncbi:hypothetical protein FMGBMHLM_3938 [Methylobacterium aerolatum]|nr:hypothetical protein FMGBMHLM_3938 [Methylobacterium aerolatum]